MRTRILPLFSVPLLLAMGACKDKDEGLDSSPLIDDTATDTDTGGPVDTDTADPIDTATADLDSDGVSAADGDCDDDDASVYPGADEDPSDGVDNDCDGTTDEVSVANMSPGDLIITEIMKNPEAVSDNDGEWFEVYNSSGATLDLEGLQVSDAAGAQAFEVDGETLIEPDSYFVFGVNGDNATNGGVTVDYDYGGFGLADEFEIVLDADGFEIDAVAYNDADFPDVAGTSMMLFGDATAGDNSDGANWCNSTSAYGDGDYGTPGAENDACLELTDADGDGYYAIDDCDDSDAAINPGAAEIWYDDVDQDCDGNDDDQDGDGFDVTVDCDDTDGAVNPDADEVWYDGVDQDCDGANDYDQDGDGEDSDDYFGTDCDDTDAAINSSAAEIYYDGVDQDCDGASDYDADGDGEDSDAYGGDDCDDTDGLINTSASDLTEDGTDQNCDGIDGLGDNDGDGYTAANDCDDDDADINPGADEICDDVDNDCDGDIDDDDSDVDTSTGSTWYRDSDSDGFGDPDLTTDACEAPSGYVADDSDCDDGDSLVYPGAPDDATDGVDSDCDGEDAAETSITLADLSAGDLVITEVMPNPGSVSDRNGEWFEVYNNTVYKVDLNGLEITDDSGESVSVSDTLEVLAGGYVVLGVNDSTSTNGNTPVDYDYGTYSEYELAYNDAIYISYDGTTFDSVAYETDWNYTDGISMSLDPDNVSGAVNDDVDDWCRAQSTFGDGDYGTPGAENEECPDDGDGDGYNLDVDCDDGDADVNPGADEIWYDGVDQDCDEASDYDQDGDGEDSDSYGGADCDDTDASVNSSASDDSVDGTDQDCDGIDGPPSGDWDGAYSGDVLISVDAGFFGSDECVGTLDADVAEYDATQISGSGTCTWSGALLSGTYSLSFDGTLSGDTATGTFTMTGVISETWVGSFSGSDPMVLDGLFSGSTTYSGISIDYDGVFSLETEGGSSLTDGDGDGYYAEEDDCDDDDASVYPGAEEIEDDGIDQDCDGADATSGSSALSVDDLSAGDLVINEIIQNPSAVNDDQGEWFELYNASGSDVDLDGLIVADDATASETFTVSGELIVGAGEYVVFGVNDDTATNGGAGVDYDWGTTSSLSLGNSSDGMSISNSTTVIDEVYWDNGSTFPDPNGASMNLDPDTLSATDNDDGANWCEASTAFGDGDYGTPGAANDDCVALTDSDGDGYFAEEDDCDDDDASVYPGAEEIYEDGIDQDCDGADATYTYDSADMQTLVDAGCAGCHTGGGASGGLNLDDVYSDSVNVPSADIPSMDLIEPGDPENSYIWLKLNNTHSAAGGAGSAMPLGSYPLDSAYLDMVETWINEGAPE